MKASEITDSMRRAIHRTPNYQCDWCRDSATNPRCTNKATCKWGNHWFCDEHGERTKMDIAPQSPVAAPLEQKPGIHGSGLVLRINGQIRGGKNNMLVTRDGKHVANKDWARWRDSAVLAVQLQLPPDWRPITEAAPIMLDYVASSHQRRDQPAILDSIFHVLEKAGVVKDDTLLWATRSTRTYDKEAPKAVITFL